MLYENNNIAIIGCGTMGGALARGLSSRHQLFLYDRNPGKTQSLHQEGHGMACQEMQEALEHSQIVILAIKPQNFEELAPHLKNLKQPLISILSGVRLARLKDRFPCSRVLRLMPNLALLCGEAALGFCGDVGEEEKQQYTQLFAPLGKVFWIPESKMDAFTSLAGSGPAFAFALIEAMTEAGIAMGFKAEEAKAIVQQMLKGSLALLDETAKHPAELRWMIASPGGTTIAGLKTLEQHAVRGSLIETFLAAYERARQLS